MSGATVGQILGQARQLQTANRYMWGTVVSATATSAVVQMEPGGQTPCEIPKGVTTAAGDRVLILIASIGNILLAVMPPLAAALEEENDA